MKELQPGQYERVRSLFEAFDYSLSIRALIEGNNPGRVFVDDVLRPRTALAMTVEGTLLAGDYDNPTTNGALRDFLRQRVFTGEVFVEDDWSVTLAVHPQAWEARLPDIIPTHQADLLPRYHYLCCEVTFDWRGHLPQGYTVRRIDRSLLSDPSVNVPSGIPDWMRMAWGTVDNFLSRGVGFCVLHGQEVVSWSQSDCTAADRIDIGARTEFRYRRRGLAAIAVAATAEFCLRSGFTAIGWHCEQDNVGSWKTAEKVGFRRNREYVYYYYIFDPLDHLAQMGWSCFKRGEYDRTIDFYQQVFAQRDENPDYYYHLAAAASAALGRKEDALKYLNQAVDRGWSNAEATVQVDEFNILHGAPQWEAVLQRMRGGCQ